MDEDNNKEIISNDNVEPQVEADSEVNTNAEVNTEAEANSKINLKEEDAATDVPKVQRKKSEVKEYVISIVVALILALLCKNFVFARADVDGPSMLSTLHDKDVLFVEKISLYTHSVKKGQIIIFDSHNELNEIFVKRVIATAGDTVQVSNGKVFLNGTELKEPYLDPMTVTREGNFLKEDMVYKVPSGYIFAMGDNRENSLDSRSIGAIKVSDLKGHVVLRAYPFNSFRTFN